MSSVPRKILVYANVVLVGVVDFSREVSAPPAAVAGTDHAALPSSAYQFHVVLPFVPSLVLKQ